MSNRRSISAALVTLPIGAFGIYMIGVAIMAIGPAIWGSLSDHLDKRSATIARVAQIEQDGRDLAYASACPAYFEASFMDKHIGYRHLSWCENYADKMPK